MSTKTPHVHAAVIKAWADGAEIQCKSKSNTWIDVTTQPTWWTDYEYRVKPEPKPDVVEFGFLYESGPRHFFNASDALAGYLPPVGKLKLIFDGETHQLKEVIHIKDA